MNAQLKPGSVAETVTVEATPLLNQTDTTTEYILDEKILENIPLGTGSFTQTAILSPGTGTNGVPACDSSSGTQVCDTFENGYTEGQRNIFRGPFQNRWDLGAFKNFRITERFALRYDVNAFNIFNHPSFDVPNNSVDFNAFCNPPGPSYSCSTVGYAIPPLGHLGELTHTIGSPRFLQMALHLTF